MEGVDTIKPPFHDKKDKRKFTRQRTQEIFLKLGPESNTHGIAKIVTSNSMKRKLFWTALFMVGVIGSVTHLTMLCLKYVEYNSSFMSEEISDPEITFPFVTICPNQDPFKYPEKMEDYLKDQVYEDWNNIIRNVNDQGKAYKHFQSWRGYLENIDNILELFVSSCEDILISCRYREKECSCDNFRTYTEREQMLNCFTFNISSLEQRPNTYSKDGLETGLTLILALNDQDIRKKFEKGDDLFLDYDLQNRYGYNTGFKLQIHTYNTIPTPMNHGLDISTGTSTTISLKSKTRKIQPYPYSNCSDKPLKAERTYKRTAFTCNMLCKQKSIVKHCNCLSSALPTLQNSPLPFCGTLNNWKTLSEKFNKLYMFPNQSIEIQLKNELLELSKPVLCELDILESESDHSKCKCQPCFEQTFDRTVSLSNWPEEAFIFKLLQQQITKLNQKLLDLYNKLRPVIQTNKNISYTHELLRKVRNNIARVNIYFEDLDSFSVKEVPSYLFADLMADVGGVLGLWIGISALSLMEMVELITMLICVCRKRDLKNDRFTSNEVNL